jgi:hypothetical protein
MDSRDIAKELTKDMPKYKEHGQYQMSLGSLIKALQKERVGLPIKVGPEESNMTPGMPHSYYGHHSDLAFKPSTDPITVAEFLKVCEDSMYKSFVAPDGSPGFYQDYTMIENTPLWISELDTASKMGIVDIVPTDGYIQLVTKIIEEEEIKQLEEASEDVPE